MIKSKLIAALTAVAGVFWFLFKSERVKRKAAEQEAMIEKSNRIFVEKESKVKEEIAVKRESWDKEERAKDKIIETKLDDLRDEEDNIVFTDNIISLLNEDDNKKRTH